jgi:CheY-like chemotaxis protein
MTGRTVNILLVEDNVVDQEAIRRAFDRQRIANPIVVAYDGLEALHRLRGTGDYEAMPRPFLVLLDLNLPRMNGIEVLRAIREDPELHDSIVFVLTTSKRDEDRAASYNFNVAGYILKSEVGEQFVRLISLLDHYWRIVEFPE